LSEKHFDEFDSFLGDCRGETSRPRSLQDIIRERGAVPSARELCQERLRSFQRESPADPFERLMQAEEVIGQARIGREIKKAAAEPAFEGEATAEPGDLSYLVGLDQVELEGDPRLPAITAASRVPDSGRVGDRILSKRGGGSLLDGSAGEIFSRVAARMPIGSARRFAESLASRAESEGV